MTLGSVVLRTHYWGLRKIYDASQTLVLMTLGAPDTSVRYSNPTGAAIS